MPRNLRNKLKGIPLMRQARPLLFSALVLLILTGCSVKGMAMNSLANALSGDGGGSVYLTDNDPVLVGEALPFSLKLMETVLQETPEHEGLLLAAATGFVSYAEMWVLRPARYMEDTDLHASRRERMRAKALFLRAWDYAGRAMEVRHPGLAHRLLEVPDSAVGDLGQGDLPNIYWFAAALGRAISTDLSDAGMVVEISTVTALINRGLELDEGWNQGSFHELMMGIPSQLGGGPDVAEEHFHRAMELNGGTSLGPLVSFAESVCVARQDREMFTQVLDEVMAFDPDLKPANRLTNILAQEQAAWLLARADKLFWMDSKNPNSTPPQRRMIPWPPQF